MKKKEGRLGLVGTLKSLWPLEAITEDALKGANQLQLFTLCAQASKHAEETGLLAVAVGGISVGEASRQGL